MASTVAIEADDGLDGRPGDGVVERLCEPLQRFPSHEEVDRRLFADRRQRGDGRASIADENRSVLPGRSHPCASTPVELPDRDLLHVSHCHTSLVPSASRPTFEKVLSQLGGRSNGRGLRSPGRASGASRRSRQPDRSKPTTCGSRRRPLRQTFPGSERQRHTPGWAASRAHHGRAPGSANFMVAIAAHFPAHAERVDRVLTLICGKPYVCCVSSKRRRTERPPPALLQ